MDRRMGVLLREEDRMGLHFARHVRQPPDVVWAVLTESEYLREWLPCDIVGERRAGAAITLRMWPDQIKAHDIPAEESGISGEIRRFDVDSLFEWTWGEDLVRFELEPGGLGTQVLLTVWLGGAASPDEIATKAAGFHMCMDQLVEVAELGRVRVPLVDLPALRYRALYAMPEQDGSTAG
jgi:uncharacterized protein YndB with AHSA1/START domain